MKGKKTATREDSCVRSVPVCLFVPDEAHVVNRVLGYLLSNFLLITVIVFVLMLFLRALEHISQIEI
jgi:hypothetical protein